MTDFFTVWTDTGLTKLGDATLETPFKITTAVVGDGNGNAVIPDQEQTGLVNPVWAGPIGSKIRDKEDPNTLVFEFVIPATEGPFYIREVGLEDEDGDLCYVGNFPETEKPVAADGSVRDIILRIPVHFENANVVSLVINPNVTVPTKAELLGHTLKQLDPSDDDTTKEKHLSNAQAKLWHDHINDQGMHKSEFASGDSLLFPQASAPLGYTKKNNWAGTASIIVGNNYSYGGNDNPVSYTTKVQVATHANHVHTISVNNHTLSISQMPIHSHKFKLSMNGAHAYATNAPDGGGHSESSVIENTGGGGSHKHTASSGYVSNGGARTHSITQGTYSPRYVTVISAKKD